MSENRPTKGMVRCAMTETVNAYDKMPARVKDLSELVPHLEDLRAANVAHNIDLIRQAAARGVQVVGLGEFCTTPYFAMSRHPMWLSLAEDPLNGPSITAFSEVAAELEVVIVAPIYERCRQDGRLFNTAVVIDADGMVLGGYRKTHVPDGSNEKGSFHERFYYEGPDGPAPVQVPGANISNNLMFPVFRTRWLPIGVSICYDRHFGGVHRSLAENGAHLIFAPAVTFGEQSERMWELEFPVDAARYRVWIAGSNRLGAEAPWGQHFYGRSYVAAPDGRPEVDRSTDKLVIFDVPARVDRYNDPSGWRLVEDRRDDLYGARTRKTRRTD
ncbi:MAG: hypothetical protein KC502_07805 [Myxococcales bacterium]|nr:hypothetical protein [Myxococcales bacterium]